MADELIQVDTSVLERLVEANRQRSVLDDFRNRADQMKDKVDETVYRRVMDDYQTRLQALEDANEPLRNRARIEFEKLRAAAERLEGVQERTRLEKQELEFRQQIGEFDAVQLAERLVGPRQTLDECRAGLTRLESYRARFVEAFGSEESLLGMMTRRTTPAQMASGDARTPAPRAVLNIEGDGVESMVYALGAVARIGRADENDIAVQSRGMSRHHAVITANAKGFALRDLGSQNGTLINGERVNERQLADGDAIAMGDARMTFQLVATGRR